MTKSRITENFVKLLNELEASTNSDPANLVRALGENPQLLTIVRELDELFRRIEHHRKSSKLRYIPQAYEGFDKSLVRYRAMWSNSWVETFPRPDLSGLDLSQDEIDSMRLEIQEEGWDFDPDLHSAGHHVETVLENTAYKAEDTAFFSRAAQGWKWFQETMELDLVEMEKRWHEFPVISVKQAVSDSHGLKEQKSLYAYLDNVRKAYVAGCFLAALAMCRAATEIIIKKHYFPDENSSLGTLIKKLGEEFPDLRKFNFYEKKQQADQLLHFGDKWQIQGDDHAKQLVQNWIGPIQSLIDSAPENRRIAT